MGNTTKKLKRSIAPLFDTNKEREKAARKKQYSCPNLQRREWFETARASEESRDYNSLLPISARYADGAMWAEMSDWLKIVTRKVWCGYKKQYVTIKSIKGKICSSYNLMVQFIKLLIILHLLPWIKNHSIWTQPLTHDLMWMNFLLVASNNFFALSVIAI